MKFRPFATRAAGVLIAMLGAVSVHAAGDASKAAQTATQVCAACHGADGNSAIGMYPNLAGQHPEYIAKQLDNFKTGERENAIMAGMVATLTAEDMANLGAYFGSQTAKDGVAKSNGPGSLGEQIYRAGVPGIGVPACASCHGPAGAGIPVQFPRLAGQHADYTAAQLKAFRTGDRANDGAKMMRMIATKLSDQDIEAVADYIQGLK